MTATAKDAMGLVDYPLAKYYFSHGNKMLKNGQQTTTESDLMPSEDEIETLFSKVLATMDLPPDKSKVLWSYDKDRKWEIIKDQRKMQAKQKPGYYLTKLRSSINPKASRLSKRRKNSGSITANSTQILRDLEISLRTNSIDWVREFLSDKNDGLNVLIDYLTYRLLMLRDESIEPKHHVAPDDVHVCIMCLRSIMNNKRGFNMVMEHPQAINCLALSLNHTSIRTQTLALELLAAICLVKGGHELIMAAFDNFKLACHERRRFETLLHYLKNQEKFNVDFMVACLQFINIIVHSADDMNYRTHLQYEFTNLGLDTFLDKLKLNESEELQVQLQTYLDNRIDVSALTEEAEAKNAALEQVQQLLEKLSIANELHTNILLKCQALESRLADEIKRKESPLPPPPPPPPLSSLPSASSNHQQNQSPKSVPAPPPPSASPTFTNHQQNQAPKSAPAPPPPPPPPPSLPTIINQKDSSPKSVPASLPKLPPPPPPPPPPLPPGPDSLMSGGVGGVSLPHRKGMAPQPPGSNSIQNQQALTTRALQNHLTDDPNSLKPSNCDMMTLKKTFSTQYKLPTFNWSILKPNQVRGTIFNEFHDEEKIIKSIDFQQFEELFKLGAKKSATDANKSQQLNKISPPNHSSSSGISNAAGDHSDAQGSSPGNTLNATTTTAKRFKQPEKVSFMDHNRLRNMAISLRKLSTPTDLLVNYINRLHIDQLSIDSIEILLRMIPQPQEIKAYQQYEAEGKPLMGLTEEDKFLCQIGKIERLEEKIKIMFYMKNLEVAQGGLSNTVSSSYSISSSSTDSGDLLAATKAKIEYVESASKWLRNSEGIRILLEYILVFGNYLNSSSRSLASAPAYGFKLQALDMVTEARSTQDKSRNLLHFIVDTIMKNLNSKEKAKLAPPSSGVNKTTQSSADPATTKWPAPLGGASAALDMESIKMPYDLDGLMAELEQAANVSLETLLSEVKEFERGIELCVKELHVRCAAAEPFEAGKTGDQLAVPGLDYLQRSASPTNNPNPLKSPVDETIARLQRFVKSRSCDILDIRESIQRAQKEFNECTQYFGENPRTIESSSLFSIFLRSLKHFRQCQVDNKMIEKRKFDEELRRQIQQQQAIRAKKRQASMEQQQALKGAGLNQTPTSGNNNQSAKLPQHHASIDMNENRLLHQDEVSHGTLDILLTGLKVEPYRRIDGSRKSIRRL